LQELFPPPAPAWLQIARLGTGSALRNIRSETHAGAKRGLEILYGVYCAVMFLLWIVPSWAIVQFIKDRKKAGRFTSSALKRLFALVGCDVRVVGKEYMETPGAKSTRRITQVFRRVPLMLGLACLIASWRKWKSQDALHRHVS